jgi:putative ABC transport system substrate-binding protein
VIARRHFVVALGLTPLALSRVCVAQQAAKVPRVGFLMSETVSAQADTIEAVRAGLRDHGYIDGKNIAIELRSAEGHYDRLPGLAAELTRLNVDVIVAFGSKAVSAAVRATTTIPIVDTSIGGDLGALGLGNSLARPGKNVTGVAVLSQETGAKRVEFLKEALPQISLITVLVNPLNASTPGQVQAIRATAASAKVELEVAEVRTPQELREAIMAAARRARAGLVVSTDTLLRVNLVEIATLAANHALPAIGPKEFAAVGGLMGYSPDRIEVYRRAAYFVDRILKGAKPYELPIERVTRVELVINAKTAKALGITIPQSLLLRADEVIQ